MIFNYFKLIFTPLTNIYESYFIYITLTIIYNLISDVNHLIYHFVFHINKMNIYIINFSFASFLLKNKSLKYKLA